MPHPLSHLPEWLSPMSQQRRAGRDPCVAGGMQAGAAAGESGVERPQKIKTGTALRPRDPTSENSPEENENTNFKRHTHPRVRGCVMYYRQEDRSRLSAPTDQGAGGFCRRLNVSTYPR